MRVRIRRFVRLPVVDGSVHTLPLPTADSPSPRAGDAWQLTQQSDDPNARETAIEEACDCPLGGVVTWDQDGTAIEPDLEPSIGLVKDTQAGRMGPMWVPGGIPIESPDGLSMKPAIGSPSVAAERAPTNHFVMGVIWSRSPGKRGSSGADDIVGSGRAAGPTPPRRKPAAPKQKAKGLVVAESALDKPVAYAGHIGIWLAAVWQRRRVVNLVACRRDLKRDTGQIRPVG
jgi:hypothetical protein